MRFEQYLEVDGCVWFDSCRDLQIIGRRRFHCNYEVGEACCCHVDCKQWAMPRDGAQPIGTCVPWWVDDCNPASLELGGFVPVEFESNNPCTPCGTANEPRRIDVTLDVVGSTVRGAQYGLRLLSSRLQSACAACDGATATIFEHCAPEGRRELRGLRLEAPPEDTGEIEDRCVIRVDLTLVTEEPTLYGPQVECSLTGFGDVEAECFDWSQCWQQAERVTRTVERERPQCRVQLRGDGTICEIDEITPDCELVVTETQPLDPPADACANQCQLDLILENGQLDWRPVAGTFFTHNGCCEYVLNRVIDRDNLSVDPDFTPAAVEDPVRCNDTCLITLRVSGGPGGGNLTWEYSEGSAPNVLVNVCCDVQITEVIVENPEAWDLINGADSQQVSGSGGGCRFVTLLTGGNTFVPFNVTDVDWGALPFTLEPQVQFGGPNGFPDNRDCDEEVPMVPTVTEVQEGGCWPVQIRPNGETFTLNWDPATADLAAIAGQIQLVKEPQCQPLVDCGDICVNANRNTMTWTPTPPSNIANWSTNPAATLLDGTAFPPVEQIKICNQETGPIIDTIEVLRAVSQPTCGRDATCVVDLDCDEEAPFTPTPLDLCGWCEPMVIARQAKRVCGIGKFETTAVGFNVFAGSADLPSTRIVVWPDDGLHDPNTPEGWEHFQCIDNCGLVEISGLKRGTTGMFGMDDRVKVDCQGAVVDAPEIAWGPSRASWRAPKLSCGNFWVSVETSALSVADDMSVQIVLSQVDC